MTPSACGTQTQVSSYKQSRGIRIWSRSVAFSPDGNKIASASGDNRTIRLWNAHTGEQLQTITGTYELWSIAWRLAQMETKSQREEVGDFDGDHPLVGHKHRRAAYKHSGGIRVRSLAYAFSPDGNKIASGSFG